MKLVRARMDEHGPAILEILNEAIRNTTAIYDYQPRTLDGMRQWFAAKESGNFPVIGLEGEDKQLMGFASYGPFRAFPAYRYTVESAVYVHQHVRGKGGGRRLMQELIRVAGAQELHTLVACIDMQNEASIRLHENLGFSHCGVIRQAGYKFGRWLDAGFFQLILETPANPVEG